MNTQMFDVNQIDLEFEIFWEVAKTKFPILMNTKTVQTAKVKTVNGVEVFVVNRKKGGVFVDENNHKPVVRERFFVMKTGYYPNKVKATAKNLYSMTVFKSVYKQYEKYLNTPLFSLTDIYMMKKTLNDIKKLANNF